jgi:hypothetical protein
MDGGFFSPPTAQPALEPVAGAPSAKLNAKDELLQLYIGAGVPVEAQEYLDARGIATVGHLACSAANVEKFVKVIVRPFLDDGGYKTRDGRSFHYKPQGGDELPVTTAMTVAYEQARKDFDARTNNGGYKGPTAAWRSYFTAPSSGTAPGAFGGVPDVVEHYLTEVVTQMMLQKPKDPLDFLYRWLGQRAGRDGSLQHVNHEHLDNPALKRRLFMPSMMNIPEIHPEMLVTISLHPNGALNGIYQKLPDDFENAPAFKSVAVEPERYIYNLMGKHWVLGSELGGKTHYAMVEDSPAKHPAQAGPWLQNRRTMFEVRASKDILPNPAGCPNVIAVSSKYDHIHGGYTREIKDFEFYPVYYNCDKRLYFWHDLFKQQWVLGAAVTSGAVLRMRSNAPHPALISKEQIEAEEGIDSIEAVTWDGVLQRYLKTDVQFTDVCFPSSTWAIGKPLDEGLEWIRATELNPGRQPSDCLWMVVQPQDLLQWSANSSWIAAAFACAAEFPSVIEYAFEASQAQESGRYDFRLWDVAQEKEGAWLRVTIDDLLPCKLRARGQKEGTPYFAQTSMSQSGSGSVGEFWPCLLEKAFAKFAGSYGRLLSMTPGFVWQALTGINDICRFSREADGTWRQFWNDVERQRDAIAEGRESRRDLSMIECFPQLEGTSLFQRLSDLDMNGTIMSATIVGKAFRRQDGLVEGHAYSILAAIRISPLSGHSVRLVLLRNPWGSALQWNGNWSDGSDLWKNSPEVQRQVSSLTGTTGTKRHDGMFWMSWEDFERIFSLIEALQLPEDPSGRRERDGVARQVGARLLNTKQGSIPVLSQDSRRPGRVSPRVAQGEADILSTLAHGYASTGR